MSTGVKMIAQIKDQTDMKIGSTDIIFPYFSINRIQSDKVPETA